MFLCLLHFFYQGFVALCVRVLCEDIMQSRTLCVFGCVVRMSANCGCVVGFFLLFFIYCLFYFFVNLFAFVFVVVAFFMSRFCGILCVCCARALCAHTRCMRALVSCAWQLTVVVLWVCVLRFLFIVGFNFLVIFGNMLSI